MDDGSRLPWIIAGVLILLAAWFAAVETSLTCVSRIRMKTQAERGSSRASKALYALDHFDRAITTLLIGTNIVHLSAAAVVTAAVTRRWGLGAVSLSTLVTTAAVFFAGEILPKSMARKFCEKIILFNAGALCLLMKLFFPLSSLLSMIGNQVKKHSKQEEEPQVTEEEIYDIIDDMTEEGTLDEDQGELIVSAMKFGDLTAGRIYTDVSKVVAAEIHQSAGEVLELVKDENHSRIPVYDGDIDHIVGTLKVRNFLKAYLKDGEKTEISKLLDDPFFTSKQSLIDDLLPIMSSKKMYMAIIKESKTGEDGSIYMKTVGLVTMEDMLEELVGEIWDEEDEVPV